MKGAGSSSLPVGSWDPRRQASVLCKTVAANTENGESVSRLLHADAGEFPSGAATVP